MFSITLFLAASSIGMAACKTDTDCDDGNYCNGVERCLSLFNTLQCSASTAPSPADRDGDGHDAIICGGDDCNDSDGNSYPGNVEICDAANHDEDCDPFTFGAKDTDKDSFVDASCCNIQPDSSLTCGTDCDDTKSQVHPNQVEVCNGIDDNCQSGIDENLLVSGYPDADGDGFGQNNTSASQICPGTPGYSYVPTDCDDQDVAVHPGSMRCVPVDGTIQTCGKLGTWQVPVPCPVSQSCVSQPNGTGLCLPHSADINGDGQIGLPEAINALKIASGQS